ncbi:DUF6776 family protein [Shewanella salipaludis]|uniref:Uncharacterized protein n=1 Tax=Shewanella salipaludis TaxID=2723052 RepID=A0A972G220_9GAMM|nr:DUF6776 family protein [Shewanella salipaludis]NMH65759.1 hypothetical protein [Shewanella salipaludis]
MLNYHRWRDRLQVLERKFRPSSLYLSLLVLVAFTLGGLSCYQLLTSEQPLLQHNSDKVQKLLAQVQEQAQQLASRNLELAVEREANNHMQQMFAEQLQQQQELQHELGFYRSIMAPENNAEGVAIHGLELTPGLLAGQYRLKLILTQLQKRRQKIKGKGELTLMGIQEGEPLELSLSQLMDGKLNFDFRYFQVLEAEFSLPEGFNLQRILAKVIVPSSRWTKGSQTEQSFDAAELLQGEKEPRVILEQNSQVKDNLPQQTEVRGSND